MGVVNLRFDARKLGSMNDRVDTAYGEWGILSELRNAMIKDPGWDRRAGWAKDNTKAMPWSRAIRMHAYVDTQRTRHILVLGDDGNLYHNTNWDVPVVLHDDVIWDGTYRATFADWRDDCFIALGSLDGVVQNIRYNGILGAAFGVSLDAPTAAPTLADAGVGLIGAGTFYYKYTFYDITDLSAPFESDFSPSASQLILINHQIALSNIQTYTGTGRTIYRRIYRSDDGTTYKLLTTLTNNTTTTYADNAATNVGATAETHTPIPVCAAVANRTDGVVVWMNDEENNEPATVYIAMNADEPEAYGETQYAGWHSDPIVGGRAVRDGVMIFKQRAIHWLPRQCDTCESIIQGTGAVADATILNSGNLVSFLSPEGPRVVTSESQEDARFVGPDPFHFCLSGTWETVVKDRLKYACGGHDPQRAVMLWGVQRCATGTHNDTVIVWDYGTRTENSPTGILHVWDMMVDQFCYVPDPSGGPGELWGAFPEGFVGPVFDGQHGDGVDSLIYGTVIGQTGNVVWVDDTGWGVPDDGMKGVVLHVYDGTGKRACRAVAPCDRPDTLITSHDVPDSAGLVGGYPMPAGATAGLTIAGGETFDSTSKFWLGGFGWVLVPDGITAGNPDMVKNFPQLDVQIKA